MDTHASLTLNNGQKIPQLGLGVLGRETRHLTADAVEVHARLGIATEAWSPLGNSVRLFGGGTSDPLTHPTVVRLAEKHGKTPAQIVLCWHIQHGIVTIPKSFSPLHIAENSAIFDFTLGPQDMAAIDALDTGKRSGPDPEIVNATTFPIKVED